MPFHHFIRETDGWRTLHDETLFANPHLEVHRPTVISPTRAEPFQWTVAHRKAAVVVTPQTADGKYLLIRQERVPIRATIWEFPAGQIDDLEEPEAIRATGLRELREESGHELAAAGEVISLGHFFRAPDSPTNIATCSSPGPWSRARSGIVTILVEAITECRAFSREELRGMIASGEIRDANTLAAFARLVALGLA